MCKTIKNKRSKRIDAKKKAKIGKEEKKTTINNKYVCIRICIKNICDEVLEFKN